MKDNITSIIRRYISSKVSQWTNIFDKPGTTKEVTAIMEGFMLKIDGLDTLEGEYTIRGAKPEKVSSGSINKTHLFTNGVSRMKSSFGTSKIVEKVKMTEINVVFVSSLERARIMLSRQSKDVGNIIVAYFVSAESEEMDLDPTSEGSGLSFSLDTAIRYTIGVIFRIDKDIYDKIEETEDLNFLEKCINSVIGCTGKGIYAIKFSDLERRGLVKNYYETQLNFTFLSRDVFDIRMFTESIETFESPGFFVETFDVKIPGPKPGIDKKKNQSDVESTSPHCDINFIN